MIRSAMPLTSTNHSLVSSGEPRIVETRRAPLRYRKPARTLKAESNGDVLDGRVGVHRSNDNLQLRVDPGLLLGAFTDE